MRNIILFFIGKEAREMMAMMWATKIILGTKTYAEVPRLLKEQVRQILIENGLEELVTE